MRGPNGRRSLKRTVPVGGAVPNPRPGREDARTPPELGAIRPSRTPRRPCSGRLALLNWGMRSPKCATCAKGIRRDVPTFPFCSPRCRAADLHKWLEGSYAIPSFEEPLPGSDARERGES
ncbi:MAG: DNA gyrase inhibitor YacG [Myxococcota bacterium]